MIWYNSFILLCNIVYYYFVEVYIYLRSNYLIGKKKEEDLIGMNGYKLEDINCLYYGFDVL